MERPGHIVGIAIRAVGQRHAFLARVQCNFFLIFKRKKWICFETHEMTLDHHGTVLWA